MGTTVTRPVQDHLAVSLLDNLLHMALPGLLAGLFTSIGKLSAASVLLLLPLAFFASLGLTTVFLLLVGDLGVSGHLDAGLVAGVDSVTEGVDVLEVDEA